MEQDRSPERDRDVAAAGAGRAAPSRVRPVLSNRALARQAAAGRRLPPEVGAEMARALDADVDDVRIHTDSGADRAARALGARAFTTGADVFFREGAYAPETPRGRETLAHELRHATAGTMAGQATPSIVDPATPTVSDPAGPTEAEAGAVGRAVAAGETVPASALASRPPDAAVHRQPPEEGPRVPMQGGRPVFPPDVIADMTPRQRVDALLREQDFFVRYRRLDDVMVHGDYTEATLDERVWMIRVVQAAGPSWPYRPAPGDRAIADTAAIEVMLWKSFGGDLLNVAADNLEMFRGSYGRGRVSQVDVVAAIGTAWEQDVKAVARSYLDKNSSIVLGELETIGEAQAARQTKAPISDVTSERDLAIAETQAAAKKVIQAQKALDDLLEVPVGYQELKWQDPQAAPMRLAQKFDPEKPPEINYAGPAMGHWSMGSEAMPEAHFIDWFPGKDKAPPPGDFQGEPFTILAYDGVKHAHDMLRQEVAGFMAQYPAVFAAAQADKLDDLAKASPQDARAMVGTMLHAILDNINKTYPKLVPGENLWLKMKPIHDQLLKGMVTAPSGTKWDDPVRAAVAETIVKEFERAEFWKDLGLATLAAAAFVIAEFATGGLATFFVAAGIGIGAYQAYEKWDEYYTLSHAVGSAATEETQLVYPGQARAAFIGAVLDTVFAILNVAGPAVQWAKASRAGLVGSMVTAGTEAAEITGLETLSRRFAAREIGRKEAGQLVERSVTELGVGETARRTGLQPKDLLAYVDEQSDVGKRISAYAKAPEELPAGAAGTRVKGGYKGTPGRKAVAAATDDYPEGLVHYGLDESGANASYAKSIFEDPEREAGIWVDLDSGEHLAVQGSPDMVEGVGKEGKGWMNDPEFAGRRWHLKEHYHPTKGDGWQISRYPSPDDYEMLLLPYWGRTPPVEPPGPISSIIRWHPPKTGAKPEFTSFGYEPGVDPPFWVEFKDAKTGMIRRERIAPNARGMPDYRPWLDREAKSLNIEIDWSEHAESALGRPPAGAAALKTTTAKAGELAQTLKELATLEPAQAEAVLSGAIEELGPAEALRLVDMDWKKLAETLPKPSAAGEKLRIWRDSVVGGEIRGLLTEEQAVRTGTIGRFENDFDWNFLGVDAAENRAKAVSYLSGRFGMTPEQMRKLLAADFFTDPRRMFLYEALPPGIRDKVAARQAVRESELIWNMQLGGARASGDKVAEQQILATMKDLGVSETAGGVKALSPEEVRALDAEIDKLHGEFESALARKDLATAEQRAMDIADRQSQVNAASGGAYVSYGGVRKFAVEREAELAAKLSGEMLQSGWYTAVLDQMPHMQHALEDLGKAVTQGDVAAAMRAFAKYGDRLTNMANLGLATSAVRSAGFEELEWDFKLLYARSKIAASDPGSLQSIVATNLEGSVAKADWMFEELQQSSGAVLKSLQKEANLAGTDVLSEEVELFTQLHVQALESERALRSQLREFLRALHEGRIPDRWLD